MNTQIQQKIENALASTDHMQRATANPYLFTRILGKIQEAPTLWEKLAIVITRPQLASILVVIVLALNILVANRTQSAETSLMLQEAEQSFASEQNPSNFYIFENLDTK